jgi:hypothetical protein
MTRQFYCFILDPENFETHLTRKNRTSNFFYDFLEHRSCHRMSRRMQGV